MTQFFWTDRHLEPKRKYRFQLSIGGMAGASLLVDGKPTLASPVEPSLYTCKKVNLPEITIETSTHQYLNKEFHFPGRPKWNKVTATLIDPVDPDGTQTFARIIHHSGYVIPDNANHVTTISKQASTKALGDVIIYQYGPSRLTTDDPAFNTFAGTPGVTDGSNQGDDDSEDHIIGEWRLNNAFISKMNFGDLDYSTEDLLELEVELTYDWASFKGRGNRTVWSPGDAPYIDPTGLGS